MTAEQWIEIEYKALREEILALNAAEQSAVRFFLPAAGAVFAVPYVIGKTGEALLWSVCAGVAGLLIVAMIHALHASVDGVRKIGMYIKVGLEPRTNGGLGWENVVYRWDNRGSTNWYSETLAIAAGTVAAHVAASIAVANYYLHGGGAAGPVAVAAITAGLAMPTLVRIGSAGKQRTAYAQEVDEFLKPPRETAG